MSEINCQAIKEQYYHCLQKENLGFNPELLKYKAATSLDRINEIRINDQIIKKCNGKKLANCLSAKYELQSINERELSKYYQGKYEQEIKRQNNEALKKNTMK